MWDSTNNKFNFYIVFDHIVPNEMVLKNVGPYHISDETPIGHGSFSTVYKCYHEFNRQEFALKTISLVDIPKMTDRMKEEIEVMKRLQHPNIIGLIDAFYMPSPENAKYIHLILEYCSNGDLHDFLGGKPLREPFAKFYIRQLANGLRYLYDNKIIHRDLKPQNLVLNHAFELKITDFGFAKSFKTGYGMSETICGTPLYMAPEIMEYKKYSIKSDLWSVGVIIYEILVGKTPYEARNHMELLEKIHTTSVVFPRALEVSLLCKELIRGLLQKNPADRIDWNEFFNHRWFDTECSILCSDIADPYNDGKTRSRTCSRQNSKQNLTIIDDYSGSGGLDSTIENTHELEDSDYYSCSEELQFEMDTIGNKTPPLLCPQELDVLKNKTEIFNDSVSKSPNTQWSGYVIVETPKEYNIISDILKNEQRQLSKSVVNYMKGTYNFMKSICKK